MDLSVVILNWNTCALLEKCLRSLVCPQEGIDYEVIVVDNASEDRSREMVARDFPWVRLIANPKNIGFGAGNNVAIPQSQGRYVLFLNSDTVVMEGALPGLVAYADAHPDIGILGPKLLNGDGSLQYSCRRYPNLATGFFRNTPLGRLFPKNRYAMDYLLQDWDHATPRDVDWVSGAALMIRRELLDRIGGFDEDYYMYCEDVDLCWRANHTPLPAGIATSDAPPSVVETAIEGTAIEGTAIEGTAIEGTAIEGTAIEGTAIEGTAIEGTAIEGTAIEGTAIEGTATVETEPGNRQPAAATWRVTYFPNSVIYHLIGKSSDQAPTRMTYEFHRSQYLFYRKHYVASTPLLVRPLIPVGIALRAVGTMARYRVRYWQRRLTGREKSHLRRKQTDRRR